MAYTTKFHFLTDLEAGRPRSATEKRISEENARKTVELQLDLRQIVAFAKINTKGGREPMKETHKNLKMNLHTMPFNYKK